MSKIILIVFSALVVCPVYSISFHKYTNERGQVVYTNIPKKHLHCIKDGVFTCPLPNSVLSRPSKSDSTGDNIPKTRTSRQSNTQMIPKNEPSQY